MKTTAPHTTPSTPGASPRNVRRPASRLLAPFAAVTAAGYAVLVGIALSLGAVYPFGTGIPPAPGVLTAGWPWQAAGAVAIGAAAVAAGLAAALWGRGRPGRLLSGAAVAFAALYAVTFLGVVADTGMLAFLGYLPVLAIKLVTEPAWVLDRPVPWASIGNQFVLLGGAVLWGLIAADTLRRRSDPSVGSRQRTAALARRWGSIATWIAVVIPLLYAVTRFAWVVGIPLGVPSSLVDGLRASGDVLSPLGLASMAVVGAVLTWGLVARWGERIPGWVPWAGGRRVPVAAAVVPALLVAAAIFPAGLQLSVMGLGLAPGVPALITADEWGAYGPPLLWPLWSVSLAAAAIAYGIRRGSGAESEASA